MDVVSNGEYFLRENNSIITAKYNYFSICGSGVVSMRVCYFGGAKNGQKSFFSEKKSCNITCGSASMLHALLQ